MKTREVLRIKPGMFGEDRLQHLGMLPDGTIVIVVRCHLVGSVFLYPKDFFATCENQLGHENLNLGVIIRNYVQIFRSSCLIVDM